MGLDIATFLKEHFDHYVEEAYAKSKQYIKAFLFGVENNNIIVYKNTAVAWYTAALKRGADSCRRAEAQPGIGVVETLRGLCGQALLDPSTFHRVERRHKGQH